MEQITKLHELQATLHIPDENKTVVKTIEILYQLYTNSKLAQIKNSTRHVDILSTLQELIDNAFDYMTEEGRIKET